MITGQTMKANLSEDGNRYTAGNLFGSQDYSKNLKMITIEYFKEKQLLSDFLENFPRKLSDIGNITMKIQHLTHRHVWHQSCLRKERDVLEICHNSGSCDGKTIWLGQEGRESGGGCLTPRPANAYSGRPGGNSWGGPGKAGGHGGFCQPIGRDRPVGRMARRLETKGGRGEP
jgi:hypothetical protein